MKRLNVNATSTGTLLILAVVMMAAGTSSIAADRMQSGEWEVTYSTGSSIKICMTRADGEIFNGDEKEVRHRFEQKLSGGARCTLNDVKVSGNRVAVTTTCAGSTRTETTTYHGDSYEAENSTGMKAHARRVGACP